MKIRCVRRAHAAGRMSDQDRARLEYIYGIAWHDAQAKYAGRAGAAALSEREADEAFDRTLTIISQERQRAAQLQEEAENRILADAARFTNRKGEADIGEYGQQIIDHIHFESAALFRLDMGELSQLAHAFGRTIGSGKRMGRTRAVLLLREIFGEDTGDATAKALAEAWRALSRRKIEQFNGAGGAVAVKEDWHLPQRHDSTTIARAGFEEWRTLILATTAPERMVNPMTGLPFKPHEYEDALADIFETITWHGLGEDVGVAGARGAQLWRRRNDARFFVFKDADAWLRYHERFGGGQHLFEVMTGYLRSINHDIAAMQRLGPNPSRTIEWLAGTEDAPETGLITQHARDADAGRAALFPAHNDLGKKFKTTRERRQYAKNKSVATIRAWRAYAGLARRPLNDGWAEATASVENLMYGSKLAFTPFLMGGDIVNQAATRAFNGVSVKGMMRDLVNAFRLSRDRKELAELGVEVDVGLSTMLSEARDHAAIHGAPVTRWLVDRALTFSGLKPATMGFRAMWTMGVLHDVARHHGIAYAKLPADFRAMLARYNIDEPAWELIQATPLYANKGLRVIRPMDIARIDVFPTAGSNMREAVAARPGLTRGQEVALRLMALIQEEGEAATVSGTPRSARIFPYRPGSISGLLVQSTARLKTYTISHFQRHAYRTAEVFWRNGGGVRGMAGGARYYAWSLLFPAMALVGIGQVLAEMAKGNDPPDVTDWRFWDRVFWRTVSLGFFQDLFQGVFESDSVIQFAGRIQGPTISTIADLAAVPAALFSEEPDVGRASIRAAKNFIPRTWATDLAVDRLVWDNLQRIVDPEAEADMARRAGRIEQGAWWAPGETLPHRGPNLETIDLQDREQDLTGVR